MLGISRKTLDSLMLDAAISAGAIVRQPARCEAIESTADSVRVRVRDLEHNTVSTTSTSFTIVADGKSALPGPTPAPTSDMGIKSHWANVPGARDAIELFTLGGCYGGLAPIEGGRWNVALSVPTRRVRDHHGDIDALFAELLGNNISLQRRLAGAGRIGPWLVSPLPRFAVRRDFPARVIPIGNAAAALEPIGGEGMGLALRSAELACDMLESAHDNWTAANSRSLFRQYDRLWKVRRAGCRAAAMMVSSTNMMDIALDWMMENETVTRGAMALIGKRRV
jgi:2-polyprenyl-6-methoxyphenol hydroxylase-like FAD-dependent oxidoreductase